LRGNISAISKLKSSLKETERRRRIDIFYTQEEKIDGGMAGSRRRGAASR